MNCRVFVISLILCIYVPCRCAVLTPQNELSESLARGCHPASRPVTDPSQTVVVSVQTVIRQIRQLDEANEVLTVALWVKLLWKDDCIAWNITDFPGMRRAAIATNQIWTPDIDVLNSMGESDGMNFGRHSDIVTSDHDGNIVWSIHGVTKTSCPLDLQDYPFDTQSCEIKLGSWSYTSSYVDFTLETSKSNPDYSIPSYDWDVSLVDATRQEDNTLDSVDGPLSYIRYRITLKRKSVFNIAYLIAPPLLICVISVFSFLLPPQCRERVTFVSILFLSLIVYLQLAVTQLPLRSQNGPMLAQLLVSFEVIVACVIISHVIVIFTYHGIRGKRPPQKLVTVLQALFRVLVKLLNTVLSTVCRKKCSKDKTEATTTEPETEIALSSDPAAKEKQGYTNKVVVEDDNGIDVVDDDIENKAVGGKNSAVVNIDDGEAEVRSEPRKTSSSVQKEASDTVPSMDENSYVDLTFDHSNTSSHRDDMLGRNVMSRLHEAIQVYQTHMEIKKGIDDIAEEWQDLSKLLNRVFFVLFLLVLIVILLGISIRGLLDID